jgi:hypothetical protein
MASDPEQNRKRKEPRRGRAVLVAREVQPKKNRLGWESLGRSFFVLIGTFNLKKA